MPSLSRFVGILTIALTCLLACLIPNCHAQLPPIGDTISQILGIISWVVIIALILMIIVIYRAIQKIEKKLGISPDSISNLGQDSFNQVENYAETNLPSKAFRFVQLITIIVLALSVVSFMLAANAFLAEEETLGAFLVVIGAIGIVLSVYLLLRHRKRRKSPKTKTPSNETLPPPPPTLQPTEQKKEARERLAEVKQIGKELRLTYCRNCGSENEQDAVFCQNCGKSLTLKIKPYLQTQQVYCAVCGTKNAAKATYCKICGQNLGKLPDTE